MPTEQGERFADYDLIEAAVALRDEAMRAGWMKSAHYRRADDVPEVAL